jgi:hypothetical protein
MNLLTRFFAVLAAVLALLTVAETASAASLSFDLRYTQSEGRLTRLAVTDLTPRADLRVSVKCPKGKPCPAGFTIRNARGTVELKRLVDAQLPAGTNITVRATRGKLTASSSLTIPKGA